MKPYDYDHVRGTCGFQCAICNTFIEETTRPYSYRFYMKSSELKRLDIPKPQKGHEWLVCSLECRDEIKAIIKKALMQEPAQRGLFSAS